MSFDESLDDLITRGLDDMVAPGELLTIAYERGRASSPQEARELSMRLYRYVLDRELYMIGDVVSQDGILAVVPWETCIEESVRRIDRDWSALLRDPAYKHMGWLELTDRGRTRALELVSRREKPEL